MKKCFVMLMLLVFILLVAARLDRSNKLSSEAGMVENRQSETQFVSKALSTQLGEN